MNVQPESGQRGRVDRVSCSLVVLACPLLPTVPTCLTWPCKRWQGPCSHNRIFIVYLEYLACGPLAASMFEIHFRGACNGKRFSNS